MYDIAVTYYGQEMTSQRDIEWKLTRDQEVEYCDKNAEALSPP